MNQETKILIVDDDRDILKVISANLKLEGYNVITAENGLEAYNLIKKEMPDLIILDLNLPDIDGVQLCTKLRKEEVNVPLIMLTARDSISDRVLGLECGADDYIVKPFNFLELSARIKSCLRRYRREPKDKKRIIEYKIIKIFPEKREVYANNQKIDLTKTEYDLFLFLIKNKGRVCSRKEIKKTLWKDKDIYDWSRTIDVHINHLRKKLPENIVITTVSGIGYILE